MCTVHTAHGNVMMCANEKTIVNERKRGAHEIENRIKNKKRSQNSSTRRAYVEKKMNEYEKRQQWKERRAPAAYVTATNVKRN